MYIDTLTTSTLTLSEDTIIYDDGSMPEIDFSLSEWVKLQYLLAPSTPRDNVRRFHIASWGILIGAGVYYQTSMVQQLSVIVEWSDVDARLSLLTLLRDHAHISVDGIGRVEKGSERVHLRVDQTNILLGTDITLRGRPVLEIQTDSIEWGHSNRTHRISGEALYYLQSHGIDASTAEGMLIWAEIERHVGVIGEKGGEIGEEIKEEIIKT